MSENVIHPPAGPALVIDGSGSQPFTGLWQDGKWLATHAGGEGALDGVFIGVRHCLNQAGLPLESVTSFLHNEGPGSVLGIRVSAMAIRTWRALPPWRERPVLAFRSLNWAAAQLAQSDNPPSEPPAVITDYRKDAWLALLPNNPDIIALSHAEADRLPHPLYHLPQRKSWCAPPARAQTVIPDLASFPNSFLKVPLLHPVDEPTAYAPHHQDYRTWTPDRHRA